MTNIDINLDEKYYFSKKKTNYCYLRLVNQGLVVKRDVSSTILASGILNAQQGKKRYVKIILLWFSVLFFPISFFAKKVYTKNPNVKVLFSGRSNRKKIIKRNIIVNSINCDKFSKRDFYIRKKINNLGISPKIYSYSNNYFIEELVDDYKTSFTSEAAKAEILLFKKIFKTIVISKESYINKLINKISRYSSKIANELVVSDIYKADNIVVSISHGDLINKNIIITNERKLLIDFEFCAYRSEHYDEYYEKYYYDKNFFKHKNCTAEIIIFYLERLLLILSLNFELSISYEQEIQQILDYIKTKEMDF